VATLCGGVRKKQAQALPGLDMSEGHGLRGWKVVAWGVGVFLLDWPEENLEVRLALPG
jgi:hypothetical protein